MSTFTDDERVFDATEFKRFLAQSEFDTETGGKVTLAAKQVDKMWAGCKSDRKSISRANFVNKVVPEVASLVYGDNKPGNQLRVWQCLSKQLLASHSQSPLSVITQQSAPALPSNTAVFTNAFDE